MDCNLLKPRKGGRRVLNLGALLLLSLGLLAVVVASVGFDSTLKAVAQAGFLAFGVMGLFHALTLGLHSLAWGALNRAIGHRVPFLPLFGAITAGMAVNIITPSSYLGGEPVKVIYVGRRMGLPYQEVAGTVVLSKYLEAISFLLLFGLCTTIAAILFEEVLFRPPYVTGGVALVSLAGLLLLLGAVLWIALARRWHPLTFLVGLVHLVWPRSGFLASTRLHAHGMEDQVSRVFRENRRQALIAFGWFLLSHSVMILKPWLFFLLGARIPLGIGELCLLFAAHQALLSLQLTPSGVGTLDGGLLGTFALLGAGITEPQVMAFLLCLRFWDAVIIGSGAVLCARIGAGLMMTRRQAENGLAPAAAGEPAGVQERAHAWPRPINVEQETPVEHACPPPLPQPEAGHGHP